MRKNFNNIDIFAGIKAQNGAEWQNANGITANWKTPELIDVKPVYTKEDLEGMEHLDYAAGLPPLPPRPLLGDVCAPPLDHPPVCRLLYRRGE